MPDGPSLGQQRIAVLIDADNAQSAQVRLIFEEVARHGRATVRRIYGNWTSGNLASWKESLLDHAIQPVQQFSYTKAGGNSTDVAMVIDAMDLLHAGVVEGFALVTGDSDYTRLAARLRESGKLVLVLGRSQTPDALRRAADQFVDLELATAKATGGGPSRKPARKGAAPANASEAKLVEKLQRAVDLASEEDGWSLFSRVVDTLRQLDQAFDPRQYGRNQPIKLFRERPDSFELDDPGEGRPVRVRNRDD